MSRTTQHLNDAWEGLVELDDEVESLRVQFFNRHPEQKALLPGRGGELSIRLAQHIGPIFQSDMARLWGHGLYSCVWITPLLTTRARALIASFFSGMGEYYPVTLRPPVAPWGRSFCGAALFNGRGPETTEPITTIGN